MILEYFHNIILSIKHSCYAITILEAPTTTQELTTTTGKDFNDPWILMQTSFLINHSLNAMTIPDKPTTTEELTTTTGMDFNNHWILLQTSFFDQSFIKYNDYSRDTNNDWRSNHNNNYR